MKNLLLPFTFSIIFFINCSACQSTENTTPDNSNQIKSISITTDKALYSPGDVITFESDKALGENFHVRLRHLDKIVDDKDISGSKWTWTAPDADFQGYLAEVYSKDGNTEKVIGSIGIDVSSDWTRFPRYGFISSYGNISNIDIETIISDLNRHHINGIQFYDWLYDHHKPLAGTVEAPASSWLDIASRTNYRSTVERYIAEAKKHNMRTMFYDLCYGALEDAAQDGVKDEWYIFRDAAHTNKYTLSLSSPFRSNIYLVNPGNDEWINYMIQRVKDVYSVYDFDGYHIDQVGINGVYDINGNIADLPEGFGKYINRMKEAFPGKYNVFNAVSGFGQEKIAASKVDFLYNEVWAESSQYADLKTIIDNNAKFSGNSMNTVLAAYMNYNLAESKGTFNTPGVLMTDAVIFALGGSHIELGEHMLGKEYFPNGNLEMSTLLKKSLISYYDFSVAYQNILRDGGNFNNVELSCTDNSSSVAQWPPQIGKVVSLGKLSDKRQIIHLFNFRNATHLSWRDMDGTQAEPLLIKSMPLRITTSQKVNKLWAATPDNEGSLYNELPFTQGNGYITFTLPVLKYWTMIVLDY